MNELIFLTHTLAVIGFVLVALRLGPFALTALIALLGVFANLFVLKQMALFGFSVTCSDVFAIGAILSLNLLQEYFGKARARHAAIISLGALLFFGFMSQIHLLYIPTNADVTQGAFLTIFSPSLRIGLASLTTFFLVQLFDVQLFSRLRGALVLRVAISLFCSQLIDTVLFSFLGLYGLVESIFDIILVSFLIKCLIILLSSPFTVFARRFVKDELSV